MIRESYQPWTPIEGIPGQMYLEALHDDHEYVRLLLRGKDPTEPILRILFDTVISYRNVDESYRLRLLEEQRDVVTQAALFTVDPSQWLTWLREEARGVLDHIPLTHYAILTGNDCVDVASSFPPEVEWLGGDRS